MRSSTRRIAPLLSVLLPLLLLGGVVATPGAAAAQDRGLKGVQVEASGLWTTFMGGAFPFDETGWGGTAGLRYRWPNGLSLGVMGLHAQPEDLTLPTDDVRRHMTQWGAFGEVRYHLAQLTVVRPYIGARAGWTQLDDERGNPDGVVGDGFGYGVTVGTEIWPTDRFALRLAATGGGLTVSDYFQPGESTSGGAWALEAGVSLFFGSVRRTSDDDQDGVENRRDRCDGTPAGIQVDRSGCPIDADRDGIGDYQDECPGTLAGARVDDTGCASDPDGDGIPLGLDRCPRTPEGAQVDNQGCALDADGDGVNDETDACPDTPRGAEVDRRGCEVVEPTDADGDGVNDEDDTCPGTPEGEAVDDEGCTEVEAGLERGRLTLSNIHFAFGSTDLTEDSRQVLDQVGRALADRPELRVQIQGHTDSIGSEEANLRISRARARAVRLYLVTEVPGIGADRLEAVGRGEAEPIATNGTEQGRAQNRRVEFVVLDDGGGGGS